MILNYESQLIGFMNYVSYDDTTFSVDVTDYNYQYDEESKTVLLTEYTGNAQDIVVPELIASEVVINVTSQPNNATIVLRDLYTSRTITGTGSATISMPYGKVVIGSCSAPGYDTYNFPITALDNINKNIVLVTNIDMGQVNYSVDITYDFGSVAESLTDESIDAGFIV